MDKLNYNLHVHSVYSDGQFPYKELVNIMKDHGIFGFAITDHNCTGPLGELEKLTKEAGIELIKGVELKASIKPLLEEKGIDCSKYELVEEILCYGLDSKNKEFTSDSNEHMRLKGPYLKTICEYLTFQKVGVVPGLENHQDANKKIGFLFPQLYEKKLLAIGENIPENGLYLGATELMEYFVQNYNAKKSELKVFLGNYSSRALNELGIERDDPFYGTDIRTIIQKAKRWGKVAVLAHSLDKKRKKNLEIYDLIMPDLIEAGLDGVECNYPEHSIKEEQIIKKWQTKYGLKILTGGSDFHKKSDMPNLGKYGSTKEIWNNLISLL